MNAQWSQGRVYVGPCVEVRWWAGWVVGGMSCGSRWTCGLMAPNR